MKESNENNSKNQFNSFHKILVIGNGFDLNHGYRTRYEDFFKFLHKFREFIIATDPKGDKTLASSAYLTGQGKTKFYEECNRFFLNGHGKQTEYEFYKEKGNRLFFEALSTLRRCIFDCDGKGGNNVWYRYLDYKLKDSKNNYINIGWSGIECEIREAVKGIEEDILMEKPYPLLQYSNMNNDPLFNYLRYIDSGKHEDGQRSYKEEKNNQIGYLRRLIKDLERLTAALEVYVSVFVSLWDNEVKEDAVFSRIMFDSVINFNYTDTYERVYKRKTKCCYIHGRADTITSFDDTHLVLGIDDAADDPEVSLGSSFIGYRKYYQRIIRNTDVHYSDIISDKSQTIFFGHSMSDIDRDIILDLLPVKRESKVKNTVICALNEDIRRVQVENVARIIGKEELVRLTSRNTMAIRFIIQDQLESAIDYCPTRQGQKG